jgi:hypothetical protein
VSAHEEAAARTAGRGQALKEPHGVIRCPGQPEVAVKEHDRADWRQRAKADVGVQPVAQPERPGCRQS